MHLIEYIGYCKFVDESEVQCIHFSEDIENYGVDWYTPISTNQVSYSTSFV